MQLKKFVLAITSLVLFSVLITGLSCKKYLDATPNSSLTVPKTLSDLQALLDYSSDMNMQTPSFSEASTDDYFLLENVYSSFPQEFQGIYTWSRGPYNFQNDWSRAYVVIYASNYCLEMLSKISATDISRREWNNVKGSALFFRSYNYLNLIWEYAKVYDENTASSDLGIVLRQGSNFNEASKRASVKECYDKIIEDAKESLLYLPDFPLHVLRPSRGAAFGLLARTYLSMGKYDSAFKYSDLSLQINNQLIDYNGDVDIVGDISSPAPFKRFNKETIFYSEMNSHIVIHLPFYAYVDTTLLSQYDTNDLRGVAFFIPNGSYHSYKGSYTGIDYNYFTGIATDEMYLIRAECHARLDRKQESMDDLNTLMMKRWKSGFWTPFSATDLTDALNKILSERRKELYMRGLRWVDIKRYNKQGANIALTRNIGGQLFSLQPSSNYYALPLPADILQ